jgi:hypothetical protein
MMFLPDRTRQTEQPWKEAVRLALWLSCNHNEQPLDGGVVPTAGAHQVKNDM